MKLRITLYWPDDEKTLEPAHMTYWFGSGWSRDTDEAKTWNENDVRLAKKECSLVRARFPKAMIEGFKIEALKTRHRIATRNGVSIAHFWTGRCWDINTERAETFGEIESGIEGTLAKEALAEVQKQHPSAIFESYEVKPTPARRIRADIITMEKTFRDAVDNRLTEALQAMVSPDLQQMSTPRIRMLAKVTLDCIADEYAAQGIDQMNMIIRLVREEL